MRSFERCRVSPVTSRICEALIGSRRFACLLWARDAPPVIRCRRMSPGYRAVHLLRDAVPHQHAIYLPL